MPTTALLLVDVQNGTCGAPLPGAGGRPAGFDQHFEAAVLPQLQLALGHARQAGLEVIHTVIANLTAAGR